MRNIFVITFACVLLCGCLGITNRPQSPTPIQEHKLQGVKVAIVANSASMGFDEPNKDVMFATIQDRLGEYFTIVTNPNQANALIYLWVKSERRYDPARAMHCWHATVGTNAIRKETAQEYWRFQLATGQKYRGRNIQWGCEVARGDARIKSIQEVSKAVADKIINQIQQQNSIPSSSEYEIKFSYSSSQEKRKFQDAINDLEDTLKILPGGQESPGYIVYRVKKIRTAMSQAEIIDLIEGSSEYNELLITLINSSPGVLLFRAK